MVFGSLGSGEILLLLLVGLILFGPERLPVIARDAAKVLRQLRRLATEARDEITSELGPDADGLDLRSMNPKTFVHQHLFGDDDDSLTHGEVGRSAAARAAQDERDQNSAFLATTGHAGGVATPFDVDAT